MKAQVKNKTSEQIYARLTNTSVYGGIRAISVLVPSVNGDYAKLLSVSLCEYEKLQESSAKDIGKTCFALMQDATVYHSLLHTGFMWLTKGAFDRLLKKKYNAKMQRGKNNVWLNDIK